MLAQKFESVINNSFRKGTVDDFLSIKLTKRSQQKILHTMVLLPGTHIPMESWLADFARHLWRECDFGINFD